MPMTDARIKATANKLDAGYHQTEIMLHALGFQKRGRTWSKGGWRNYFDAGESDDAGTCSGLAHEGWMAKLAGGVYVVTKTGKAALRLAGWEFTKEEP